MLSGFELYPRWVPLCSYFLSIGLVKIAFCAAESIISFYTKIRLVHVAGNKSNELISVVWSKPFKRFKQKSKENQSPRISLSVYCAYIKPLS